jgi:hypothetical protein
LDLDGEPRDRQPRHRTQDSTLKEPLVRLDAINEAITSGTVKTILKAKGVEPH